MLFVFLFSEILCWTVTHQDLVLKFVVNLHSIHVIKKKTTFRLIKNYSQQWNHYNDFLSVCVWWPAGDYLGANLKGKMQV